MEDEFDELRLGDGLLCFLGQNLLAKTRQGLEFRRRFDDAGERLPPSASLASASAAASAAAAAGTGIGIGIGGSYSSFAKELLGLRKRLLPDQLR